jgi:hypothetical protein
MELGYRSSFGIRGCVVYRRVDLRPKEAKALGGCRHIMDPSQDGLIHGRLEGPEVLDVVPGLTL